MNFGQRTFCGLYQADTVLRVLLCGFQTGDLGTHFLRNRKASSVVASAVDLVARGELLQVLLHRRDVVGVVTIGAHRHDIVLNTH